MRITNRIVLYGLGVWGFPFLVGMLLFAIQESMPMVFDAVMAFCLVLGVLFLGIRFLRRLSGASVGQMVAIGLAWMGICLMIDIPLFLYAFDWTLAQYTADIGIGYPLIPLTAGGLAKAHSLGAERGCA